MYREISSSFGMHRSPNDSGKIAAGRLLHQRLLAVSKRVVGVDIDREALTLMRRRGKIQDLYAHNIEELNTLPVKEQFDIILAGEVVEHLDNVGSFIDPALRILSQNTKLVITLPNAYSVKWFLIACLACKEHADPDHTAYSRHRHSPASRP